MKHCCLGRRVRRHPHKSTREHKNRIGGISSYIFAFDRNAMHPFLVLCLAILTCSAAALLAHTTRPFLLSSDGLTADTLLRRALPAVVELWSRSCRQSSLPALTSKILHFVHPAAPSTHNTTPPDGQLSQHEPSLTQDVRPEPSRYEWLWVKTKRVFAKAFWNVLRRQIRTMSFPTWALGLSIRRTRAMPSGLTTMMFAASLPHHCALMSMLTGCRGLCWSGCSLYPCPA